MNLRKLLYITLMTVAVIACKKDDEYETYPYLDGSLSISGIKAFVAPGQTLTMTPKGLSHPEGKEIGYCWKVTPSMDTNDTTRYTNGLDKYGNESNGSFTYTFPSSTDSLDTYTVYCYAFAKEYTGSAATGTVTIVLGGANGSIKGIDFPEDKISTDDADYYYTNIGTQTWTMNNAAETYAGMSYQDISAISDIFGRYYNYEDAKAVCESLPGNEWKLPSKEDWEILENYIATEIDADKAKGKSIAAAFMANATFNGDTMWEYWSEVGDITNSSGFSAIPVGYANLTAKTFTGVYKYATFWTATEVEQDTSMAYSKHLFYDNPAIYTDKMDKTSFGASVRCIRK